ncbi:preprotein translocase subunit YajC [Helicobacter pylori]|uniref:Sec translocon accessory complex subunit YajC n=1 Tax=Helicobacter pylori Hp H-24 TaxID=992039 RepID=I9S830_HELPX|nr:preprotein translocase subunit YajC [Helicobacter pylori]EJB52934.1 preprotein translocase, YajC subunit [Helicobacter pylori Hp H-24]EJC03000.1 preprotein translocase, YajC subunit [Helicobacter pylori Hp P-3]EJC04673.1 preprotein translocase, YajC subunit [Helicobacter pylori Hp P-8]EJC19446.1 preprotein translocase, YajC subunit [Helicobacter pylori Hp H-24b]EJC20483.1 preprotein translocase, YajC subunit [Helicobacter pylori Hp H-24c]
MGQTKEIITTLLPFLVLFLIFYFLIVRPQRQQQKKHKEMIEGLTKGDKIVTQGGLIVEVLKAEANFFSVKLNDDTTARLSKNYVAFKLDELDQFGLAEPIVIQQGREEISARLSGTKTLKQRQITTE